MRWTAVIPLIVSAAGAAGCSEVEPLHIARCSSDFACDAGEICEEGECIPKDSVTCTAIEGAEAILQPSPHAVSFGLVDGVKWAPFVLRNIGTCTLTIFEAYMETEGTRFGCSGCEPNAFPIELFPLRDVEWTLSFNPMDVGAAEDTLVILSDDSEFSEIRVPLRARYEGASELFVAPAMLDFGYAPVGRTLTQQIQLSNRGTGTAKLAIERIAIEPSSTTAFSFVPELTETVELSPVHVDPTASHLVNVRYHPHELGTHHADLVVTTQIGSTRVPLSGTSRTPPSILVSPEAVQFGAVPIGQTNARSVTIQNAGGSPLHVSFHWGGTGLSTDLSALPQVVPPILPGEYTELTVFVTATAPSPITGLLILESDDPSRPTVTVPVSADGEDVVGAQVLKLEMVYDNSSHSFADDDLRNADMMLENPFGLVVGKLDPTPMNWGAFGNPTWIAFGQHEEPERIVLPDAMQDGTYRVLLQYAEDCSSVPTGLVAAVLGISVDVLITYLSGGAINLDSQQLSDVIEDLCINHSSASVTVTVYVNGAVIAEVPARLGRKGDFSYALDLVRTNGAFTVR